MRHFLVANRDRCVHPATLRAKFWEYSPASAHVGSPHTPAPPLSAGDGIVGTLSARRVPSTDPIPSPSPPSPTPPHPATTLRGPVVAAPCEGCHRSKYCIRRPPYNLPPAVAVSSRPFAHAQASSRLPCQVNKLTQALHRTNVLYPTTQSVRKVNATASSPPHTSRLHCLISSTTLPSSLMITSRSPAHQHSFCYRPSHSQQTTLTTHSTSRFCLIITHNHCNHCNHNQKQNHHPPPPPIDLISSSLL